MAVSPEVPQLIKWAIEYGWVANLIQILTFLGCPSIPALAIYFFRKRREENRTRQSLVAALEVMSKELELSKIQLAEVERKSPEKWLEEFRKSPDKEVAIGSLQHKVCGLESILHEIYFLLSEYLERAYFHGNSGFICEAERTAKISLLVNLNSARSRERVELLNLIIEKNKVRSPHVDFGSVRLDLVRLSSIDQKLALNYIAAILKIAIRVVREGDSGSYLIITRHGRELALEYLEGTHDLTLSARRLWAEALVQAGLYSEAIEEMRQIAPEVKSRYAEHDPVRVEFELNEAFAALATGDVSGLKMMIDAALQSSELRPYVEEYEGRVFAVDALTQSERDKLFEFMRSALKNPWFKPGSLEG